MLNLTEYEIYPNNKSQISNLLNIAEYENASADKYVNTKYCCDFLKASAETT